jgi:hypothetical protein
MFVIVFHSSEAVAYESEAHKRLKNVDRTEEDVENVQVL